MSHSRQMLERMALAGRRAGIMLKGKEALCQQEDVVLQP